MILSRKACEQHLGRPCMTIAYPYGDYDERVAAAAGRAGYQAACTLPARFHEARPLEWPRVGVYHSDDDRRFRMKVSPLVRRVRASRAWSAVDGAGGVAPQLRSGPPSGVEGLYDPQVRTALGFPAGESEPPAGIGGSYFPMRMRTTFERPTRGT